MANIYEMPPENRNFYKIKKDAKEPTNGTRPKEDKPRVKNGRELIDYSIEMEAKNNFKTASTTMTEDQYVIFYTLENLKDRLFYGIIFDSEKHNSEIAEFESKTLEELKSGLKKITYDSFTSSPSHSTAFIKVLKEKDKAEFEIKK